MWFISRICDWLKDSSNIIDSALCPVYSALYIDTQYIFAWHNRSKLIVLSQQLIINCFPFVFYVDEFPLGADIVNVLNQNTHKQPNCWPIPIHQLP